MAAQNISIQDNVEPDKKNCNSKISRKFYDCMYTLNFACKHPMQNQLRTTELEEKTKMLTDQQDVIHAFIHVSPITPEPKPALQDHPTLLQ